VNRLGIVHAMRIAVSGSTGFIGRHLCAALRAGEHDVVPMVRGDAGAGEIGWAPDQGKIARNALDGCDAVVHLAAAGIGDKRWSEEYKRTIRESRVRGTSLIAETIAKSDSAPAVFVCASAVGVYGDRGDEVLDEQSAPGGRNDFLASVVLDGEAATEPARAAGVRVVNIRSGVVLGKDGGALAKQLPIFRFGLGGRFGGGTQWQSWISIVDHVRAVEHVLSSSLDGPVNFTAPSPVTNAEFTKTLARVLNRPALLPIPKFGPSLVLGSELTQTLLYSGQRVMPAALLADGFAFTHPTLEVALRALLDR
jgi:uncharacterized protein (TIGR01777 family)